MLIDLSIIEPANNVMFGIIVMWAIEVIQLMLNDEKCSPSEMQSRSDSARLICLMVIF